MINKTAAIIAAAGAGNRLAANLPKALVKLVDKTLVEHAVAALSPVAELIIITAPAGYEDQFSKLLGDQVKVITGGVLRSDSIRIALSNIPENYEYVLVHDGARALATTDLAQSVVAQLVKGEQAVIPALDVVDTIKEVDASGYVRSTPDRSTLRAVQTPQGFAYDLLKKAHASGSDATDDAALVEQLGARVKVIEGEERAIKITTPSDLATALQFLGNTHDFSTGVGVDAHAFADGRPLHLAGLFWPDEIGVEGHSDGDVAAHAICDALFAASNLGDLGSNFGTSRPEYAGASGAQLLQESARLVEKAGYSISHVSVQIIGNRPKLTSRRSEAIATLSAALGGANVSVLATTTDGMGLTGEGRGIAAIASALLIKQG